MSTIEKYVEEILSNGDRCVYIRLQLVKQPRVYRRKLFEDIVKMFAMMGIPLVTCEKRYLIRLRKDEDGPTT